MSASFPHALKEWLRSQANAWQDCRRADWLILLASDRGHSAAAIVRVLAQCIPAFDSPCELREMACAVREMISALAENGSATEEIHARFRNAVRGQLIDWSIHSQYRHLPEGRRPEGLPPPAPAEAASLRAVANILGRLLKANDLSRSRDETWDQILTLVALQLVFLESGSGGHPLYNHVELPDVAPHTVRAHIQLCERIRNGLGE
jgi:hypothetical protein